ncbi:MAG: P-loop NTPase fold protein [Candidatus Omnitrophota bacterium]
MSNDFRKTILLDDDPAELDYFESHQSIADAIDVLIQTEKGRKSIALIGTRGSGKSSIINFLSKIFNRNNHAKIFTFDAWSHSGDPLRRSFLEEFVKFLEKIHWVEKNEWQVALETLSRKREERDTKTEPILTLPGRLIIASTIFLPLGYALFGLIDKEVPVSKIVFGFTIQLWAFGLFMVFLPVIIVLLTWLCWRPTWKCFRKEFWTKHRAPHGADSLFSFFINKVRETNSVTTIRTPDPTTIEFQNVFKDILNDVLDLDDSRKNERKLVVVIDNLDRVDQSEAYSIWSTMRTFFDLWSGQTQKNWLEKFCLIVPFAPEFPKEVFDFDEAAVEPGNDKRQQDISKGGTGVSFVEKTFQAIFYVPLPVLSKWKDYLVAELGKAFPEHKQSKPDVFHQIYRIYDIAKVQKDGPPTPRDLKLFINKMGSRNRIWGNNIELAHQAIHVLYFDEMQKGRSFDLIKWSVIEKRILNMFDNEELQRNLAALHFNVKADIALQALAGGQVRAALQKGDKDSLKQLSENVTGFFTVLEREVTDNCMSWVEAEPNTIPMAAMAMGVFADRSAPEWNRIEDHLQSAASKVIEWRSVDEQVAEGLSIVIQRATAKGAESVLENLIDSISRTAPEQKSDQGKTVIPKPIELIKQHVKGLGRILKAFERTGQERLRGRFRIPGIERTYVQVLSCLGLESDANNVAQYFVPTADGAKVVEEFSRICNEGQFLDIHAQSIRMAIKIGPEWPWHNLIGPLHTRLQNTNNLTPVEITGCVLAFNYLVNSKVVQNAETSLEELCNQGHLFHHLAAVSNDAKGFASCLVPLTYYNPTGQLSIRRPVGNVASGLQEYRNALANPLSKKDAVDAFSNMLVDMNKLAEFLEKTQNVTEQHALVSHVFKATLSTENGYKNLPSTQLVKAYHCYRSRIDDALFEKHILNLVEKDSLMKVLGENVFENECASLYLEVIRAKDRCKEQVAFFIDFLLNGLRNVHADIWKKQLSSEGDILRLVIELAKQGSPVDLAEHYHEALLDHARDVMDEKIYPSKLVGEWNYVLLALKDDWKETFLKNMRDKLLIEAENQKKTKILELYSDAYKDNQFLEDKSEDIVRRMLTHIVKRSDGKELATIEGFLKFKADLFKKAPKTVRSIFSEVLCDALQGSKESADDSKARLSNIAALLGIQKSGNPKSSDENVAPPAA